MPWKDKRTILTQEILRVLKNCSRRLPWEEVCTHVETYCSRMQFSGYDKRFRTQVVQSALSAYDKMLEKDPYRSRYTDREIGRGLKELSVEEQRKENGLKEESKEMRQLFLFQQPQEEN